MTRRRKPRQASPAVQSDTIPPTRELAAHHDIAERAVPERPNARAWCVLGRVYAMLATKEIDGAEWSACDKFYEDYMLAHHGAASPSLQRVDGGENSRGVLDARFDAMGRDRRVREAVGGQSWDLLVMAVCRDFSWSMIGAKIGVHHSTAKIWVLKAIKGLAQHYGYIPTPKMGA